MKLSPRRFTLEEFPDQQAWIGNLISPLNQQAQELLNGLANDLTISDNLYQEIKELRFVNETGNFPIRFRTKFNKYPSGLNVIYCRDTLGSTPSGMPWIDWGFADGLLSISSITNLTSSLTYILRVNLIYG